MTSAGRRGRFFLSRLQPLQFAAEAEGEARDSGHCARIPVANERRLADVDAIARRRLGEAATKARTPNMGHGKRGNYQQF